MPRKVYDSSKNLYPWFSFLSLGLTWNKSRIHHSKKEFKYAKYLKLLPSDFWFGSLPLSWLCYIYRWQTTEKTEKPKCQPNKRRMCSHWFQSHLTLRSSEAEQKSKHVPSAGSGSNNTHLQIMKRAKCSESALFSTKNPRKLRRHVLLMRNNSLQPDAPHHYEHFSTRKRHKRGLWAQSFENKGLCG